MYASIFISELPCRAIAREYGMAFSRPLAAICSESNRAIILSCNPAAQRHGVRAGSTPAEATALCPSLHCLPRCPPAEARIGNLLIKWADTLSPRVEATAGGLVTADLRGLSAPALQQAVGALLPRFQQAGLSARLGVAATPEHAQWAAALAETALAVVYPGQSARNPAIPELEVADFLRRVPPAWATSNPDVCEILTEWGVHSLADLLRLEVSGLHERLGANAEKLRALAQGSLCRPLKLMAPPRRFTRGYAFEQPVNDTARLLLLWQRFCGELAGELACSGVAAWRIRLHCGLDNRQTAFRQFDLPEPTRKACTLLRILQTGLRNFHPAAAVVSVRLSLATTPAPAQQSGLFSFTRRHSGRLGETVDRVAALVGTGRCGSPRPTHSWCPDTFSLDGSLRQDFDQLHEDPAPPYGRATVSPLPLQRIRPPQPVQVTFLHGQPAVLAGGMIGGAIRAAGGPWHHSGGWWTDCPWNRQEWDIELADGGVFRIFSQNHRWYLEAVYG